MAIGFVHLHLHTEYSLVDGLVRVDELAEALAARGLPACALTDQCNLFALVKFYRALQARGIKPIIGVDLWLRAEDPAEAPARLVLLCQDRDGYRNLTRLVTRAYRDGQHKDVPLIERGWLDEASAGLIALSGGREGDVGRALVAGQEARARALLDDWQRLFPGRFYLEVARTGRPDEEDCLHACVALAARAGVPVVATNDVRFLGRDDFEAHEARVCIQEGRVLNDPRRPRLYSAEQYLKDAEEMVALFSDLPEALENSVEIARRCNLELTFGTNVLPDYPAPKGVDVAEHLAREAGRGFEQRMTRIAAEAQADYRQRLQRELAVITQMGFSGYFLIVADFIRWAREHDVPVGPGRGSGAGSLVAWCLGITDVDPLRYDLLFERFLNPERVSMPDFDIDFCMEGRDRVIEYVAERYGHERVSQIITYGSMAAKAVVRDVGRVLGHPYGFVDRIAKLIPFELGMTLDKALKQEAELKRLYREEDEVRALLDLARALEGLARNAGKHAGGVVIAPTDLTDFAPLYCEAGGTTMVTQFDKDDVEAVGLVKFDFLGLRTLTIIDWAVKMLAAKGVQVDITALPLDDPDTYALLKRCATTAVFQLESRGMKDLIKRLQPDCFDDIVALVALFRPGPLQSGMVEDFIDRKHGRKALAYPHPALETVLKPTYGVILYQEQVMQIAQVLAGYTLGGADELRRAMGKKKPEAMAKERGKFMEGATARGVNKAVATHIFDLMEKFAGYGFNKSHSVAYALISNQTAWLKAHYPAEFMAAVLSADMDHTDKVVNIIAECGDMGLTVRPPAINRSAYAFGVDADGCIVYGLGAIKGVGFAAIEGLITERERNGAYRDLFDFCRRMDARKVNKRVLEALVRSGALDELDANRASLMANLPGALHEAEQRARDASLGQNDLFGAGEAVASTEPPRVTVAEWPEAERLAGEKETLGLYLTGHPITRYERELRVLTSGSIADLVGASSMDGIPSTSLGAGGARGEQMVTIAGFVLGLRTLQTRRGRMAFVTLDDRTARVEVAVFSDLYQSARALLIKDRLIVVEGKLSPDEFSGGFRLSAERIHDIAQLRAARARGLAIALDMRKAGNGFVAALKDTLTPFRQGACPVWIDYRNAQARGRMVLGEAWCVQPTDELLQRLRDLAGADAVEVCYPEAGGGNQAPGKGASRPVEKGRRADAV